MEQMSSLPEGTPRPLVATLPSTSSSGPAFGRSSLHKPLNRLRAFASEYRFSSSFYPSFHQSAPSADTALLQLRKGFSISFLLLFALGGSILFQNLVIDTFDILHQINYV